MKRIRDFYFLSQMRCHHDLPENKRWQIFFKFYEPNTTVIVATIPTKASQVPQCCCISKVALVVDALGPAVLAAQGLRIDNTVFRVDPHGNADVAPVLLSDRWRNIHCAFNV